MITPAELKRQSNKATQDFFDKAYFYLEKDIKKALANGQTEVMIFGGWVDERVSDSFDARASWLARKLKDKGFRIERKSYFHQGVQLAPSYYLIF